MNIEPIFPDSDLQVYKVTNVLTDAQVKLLAKLADGRIPTGFKSDEITEAVKDIRAASVEACKNIFGAASPECSAENKQWPWFDLSVGEGRGYEDSQTFGHDNSFLSEFVIKQADGGDLIFKGSETQGIRLAPGEMLVASRSNEHDFKVTEILSGVRFTLMTHIFSK